MSVLETRIEPHWFLAHLDNEGLLDPDRLELEILKLRPKWQVVIRGRLGLGTRVFLLRELADQLGINRERVRQIEGRGFEKIRKGLRSGPTSDR